MIREIKNLFKTYFGIIVLLIPLFLFLFCYLYSNKPNEEFIGNFFSSNRDNLQNITDKTFQSNYTRKNMYTRPIPVDSSNFETTTIRNAKQTNGPLDPVGNSLFGNFQCRVLSECTDGFKPTGAEFEGIKCQNDSTIRQAQAVASIKDGRLDSIHLVDSGLGYKDQPKVMIVGGNGSDALCSAILDVDNKDKMKRSSIKKIEVKNSGRNYNSTPQVLIENPHTNHKCQLCCK